MADEPKQILENLRRLQAVIDVLSWIANRFDKAVDVIEKQQAVDDVMRELNDYLTTNFDRTDQLLLLILEKLPESNGSRRVQQQTNQLRRQTIESRITSLKSQIAKYRNNLNWLEEQAASYGVNTSLQLTNEMIMTREKIKELEDELQYLKAELDKMNF